MNNKDKKRLRKLKREIKRSGNKKFRSEMKKDLANNPDETHLATPNFKTYSSKKLNGMDKDATRRKDKKLYNDGDSSIIPSETEKSGEINDDEDMQSVRAGEQGAC